MDSFSKKVAVVAALFGCPSPAIAADAGASRTAVGPWNVSYDTAQCVAMREYGTTANPLTLAFKPSPGGQVMRLLVIRDGRIPTRQEPATLYFDDHAANTNLVDYSDGDLRITAVNMPMSVFKAKLPTRTIRVDSSTLRETFATSDLAPVTSKLDDCLGDLQNYWNIGPKYAHRIALAGQEEVPHGAYFKSSDFPVGAPGRAEGKVSVTFLVNEKGEIKDCSVENTSGVASLDTMSCLVVTKRTHISPARDASGMPIRSAYTREIDWRAH